MALEVTDVTHSDLKAPAKTMTMENDGFHGALFSPEADVCSEKALILFGGSDGNFRDACKLARMFCAEGITVLALAYWNAPGLPDELAAVPVESVQRAALWLRENGRNKIGLWGISMGAEYALLAGSLLPGLISCVVAVSAMDVVSQGCSGKGLPHTVNTSAFSWTGNPLPYMSIPEWSLGRVLRESLKSHEYTMSFAYATARPHAPEDSVIPVECITGPVLLISAKEDSMWPSAEAGERIVARLDAHDFSFAHKHLIYEFGSHMMIPMPVKLFRMERKHPSECLRDKRDSFRQTIRFLQEW